MWLRISRHFQFAYSDTISAKYRLVSTLMVRSNLGTVLLRHVSNLFEASYDRQFEG